MLPKLLLFILGLYHVLRLVGEKEEETLFVDVKLIICKCPNALVAQGRCLTLSTIKFCRISDKAFDCLNVARISWNWKAALKPYTRLDDPHFDMSGFEYVFLKIY